MRFAMVQLMSGVLNSLNLSLNRNIGNVCFFNEKLEISLIGVSAYMVCFGTGETKPCDNLRTVTRGCSILDYYVQFGGDRK
jgi:hypothetical protein